MTKQTVRAKKIPGKPAKNKSQAVSVRKAPPRTAKKPIAAKAVTRAATTHSDGPYLIKLTFYALVGLFWVKLSLNAGAVRVPIPLGFAIGIFFTTRERFQIDRKIEYAVLLAALLVGFVAPFGLYVSF